MGLNPERADCMHSYLVKDFRGREVVESERHYYLSLFNQDEFQAVGLSQYEKIPAWSLHRLIEMLPNEIRMEDYYLILGVSFDCVYYADNEYAEVFQSFDENTYSCIIKCIEWLIKEGYFNKEYLKQ
jgi:hypothetical protein